jgi:hypothetical protein
MTVMRSATLGFALALGAAGAPVGVQVAHAQTVISRQIENGLVETTVTQTPTGTVVTRRPLAAAPASTTYVDETVGAGPTTRPRHVRDHAVHHDAVHHDVVHHARRTTSDRTANTTRRVAATRPLELAPAQRRVIYRTLVQEQVVPQAVPVVPGYPPFPAPAYPARTVVVEPSATTGYAVSTPAETVDDDIYATQAAPAPVYAAPGPVYAAGSVLPASVAVTPLPASATVAVPSVRPYSYATVDNRVLLIDPATDTVVADITP